MSAPKCCSLEAALSWSNIRSEMLRRGRADLSNGRGASRLTGGASDATWHYLTSCLATDWRSLSVFDSFRHFCGCCGVDVRRRSQVCRSGIPVFGWSRLQLLVQSNCDCWFNRRSAAIIWLAGLSNKCRAQRERLLRYLCRVTRRGHNLWNGTMQRSQVSVAQEFLFGSSRLRLLISWLANRWRQFLLNESSDGSSS